MTEKPALTLTVNIIERRHMFRPIYHSLKDFVRIEWNDDSGETILTFKSPTDRMAWVLAHGL